jgi:predicted tellurium resistance membrane protein TerC
MASSPCGIKVVNYKNKCILWPICQAVILVVRRCPWPQAMPTAYGYFTRLAKLARLTTSDTPMELLTDPNTWIAFFMLAALEIVLGIDNIIFISILVGRLPPEKRDLGRRLGLLFAMASRIALLFSLAWVMRLTTPLLTVLGQEISGRDLILLFGGLFLLYKASHEIFMEVEAQESHDTPSDMTSAKTGAKLFWGTIAQIGVVDIVFSLDSVITAVGMVDHIGVMVAAVIASVAVMMFAAKPIGEFVDRHPSIKVLALAFLTMVGTLLVAEAFDVHVPKAYVYVAMLFSLAVEALNIRARTKRQARS